MLDGLMIGAKGCGILQSIDNLIGNIPEADTIVVKSSAERNEAKYQKDMEQFIKDAIVTVQKTWYDDTASKSMSYTEDMSVRYEIALRVAYEFRKRGWKVKIYNSYNHEEGYQLAFFNPSKKLRWWNWGWK